MRRLFLLAGLLVPLLLPTPVLAGTCPALEGGVVDRDAYRLGELIDFYGTYHDFADPGTVTISWERTTDGATREYQAANSPDGSWYLRLTLDSPQDVGRWTVTVVVAQTDALDTCTDEVTIGRRPVPPSTDMAVAARDGVTDPWVFALVAGTLLGWLVIRRRHSRLPLS